MMWGMKEGTSVVVEGVLLCFAEMKNENSEILFSVVERKCLKRTKKDEENEFMVSRWFKNVVYIVLDVSIFKTCKFDLCQRNMRGHNIHIIIDDTNVLRQN